MPGSWSQDTKWRVLDTGILSSLLQLSVCRPLLLSIHQCRKHRAFGMVLHTLICSPDGWRPIRTKEEWFRPNLRSLWNSGLQENFSTTAVNCSHPLHPQRCQDAKKIRTDFLSGLPGAYYYEPILLADDYFGVYCCHLGVRSWPFKQSATGPWQRQVRQQPRAELLYPLALEDRGNKVVSSSEQKPVYFDTGEMLWVLYLPFIPVLASCCVSALSKSKIKFNQLCYLEDIYSYMKVLDYSADESCGNVTLLRKVKRNHLQIIKV